MLTKEPTTRRAGRLAAAIAGAVVLALVLVVVVVRMRADPSPASMATTTFSRLTFSNVPEVVDSDEHEEGADYTLRFSKPFSIDDVTVPGGFRRLVAGEYAYGSNTAVGDFSGPPPIEVEGRACDLLFVHRADAPRDRTVIRLEVRCGFGTP